MTAFMHPKDVLYGEIALVGSKLKRPVTAYLIGGGAMSFHGLKSATKDIDAIVQTDADLRVLSAALEEAGDTPLRELGREYKDLGATRVYAKRGAPQWDLFIRVVCRKLRLSPGLKARSTRLQGSGENLELRLIAPEHIFVFKSITERQGDIRDVDALWAAGPDWDAILAEMEWQCAHSDAAWAPSFLQTLERLEAAGRPIPILKDVDALVDRGLDEWAVLYMLEQPRSRDDVISRLEERSGETVAEHVEAAIERLVKRGRILEDGTLRRNPDWDPDRG